VFVSTMLPTEVGLQRMMRAAARLLGGIRRGRRPILRRVEEPSCRADVELRTL